MASVLVASGNLSDPRYAKAFYSVPRVAGLRHITLKKKKIKGLSGAEFSVRSADCGPEASRTDVAANF